jgi:hypothetical protein
LGVIRTAGAISISSWKELSQHEAYRPANSNSATALRSAFQEHGPVFGDRIAQARFRVVVRGSMCISTVSISRK